MRLPCGRNGYGVTRKETAFPCAKNSLRLEKTCFLGACQEYILDKEASDTRFDQCLQGFRVLKKGVTMACTISAFCAKIIQ
jgi:hypothetical protein